MPSQFEEITRKVDGKTTLIGTVGTYVVDMQGDTPIWTHEAKLNKEDGLVGSYDSFEEAVEELHKAYDNQIGGAL